MDVWHYDYTMVILSRSCACDNVRPSKINSIKIKFVLLPIRPIAIGKVIPSRYVGQAVRQTHLASVAKPSSPSPSTSPKASPWWRPPWDDAAGVPPLQSRESFCSVTLQYKLQLHMI